MLDMTMRRLPAAILALAGGTALGDAAVPSGPAEACKDERASVFEHGAGKGLRTGDQSHFLEQDEARQVVDAELARAGLHLTEPQHSMETIHQVEETRVYPARSRDYKGPIHFTQRDAVHYTLDGFDPKSGIGYAFVSKDLYWRWHGLDGKLPHPADGYDMRGLAARMAELARGEAGVRHVAFFYDPGIDMNPAERTVTGKDGYGHRMPHVAAERSLRAQVADFITCLRRRGALPAAPAATAR
jgi:hypothetical protein